jgi:tRNA-Thr(GGU) m(6)t(6)A37 methyltransferase TsaA
MEKNKEKVAESSMGDFIMKEKEMVLKPIGVIRSPYKTKGDAPRQGRLVQTRGTIEIFPEYSAGLKDIEKRTHLILIYWLHEANRDTLVTPTPDSPIPRGVFSIRSPNRPNPLGLCTTELIECKGNILTVRGIDAIDGTPLMDIKPYIPELDEFSCNE